MKKVLAVLTGVALVLGFAGCTKKDAAKKINWFGSCCKLD